MKRTMTILTGVLVVLTGAFGTIWGMNSYYYRIYVSQYLRLADDASLPALKRDYLIQYRDRISAHIERENARYVFQQERLTKEAQLQNLNSLIVRLEDIAKLSPDSLAYQQGMQQITGQEFDHTINTIDGTFKDCWLREALFRRFIPPIACLSLGILAIIAGCAAAIMWVDYWM